MSTEDEPMWATEFRSSIDTLCWSPIRLPKALAMSCSPATASRVCNGWLHGDRPVWGPIAQWLRMAVAWRLEHPLPSREEIEEASHDQYLIKQAGYRVKRRAALVLARAKLATQRPPGQSQAVRDRRRTAKHRAARAALKAAQDAPDGLDKRRSLNEVPPPAEVPSPLAPGAFLAGGRAPVAPPAAPVEDVDAEMKLLDRLRAEMIADREQHRRW
jgi:hypothetical protein